MRYLFVFLLLLACSPEQYTTDEVVISNTVFIGKPFASISFVAVDTEGNVYEMETSNRFNIVSVQKELAKLDHSKITGKPVRITHDNFTIICVNCE